MTAQIIDGKLMAREIRNRLKEEIGRLKQNGRTPGLVVIIIGENPASQSYVKAKIKACEELGIYSRAIRLPQETTEAELLRHIEQLNHDDDIDGILVQLPLPEHISEKPVIDAIRVDKDVDGFHPVNIGNMLIGDECFLPCTPHGIIEMIRSTGTEIAGKHAVVIGRSNIVGKPVAMLLLQQNATVTVCHSQTTDLEVHTKQADILVVAVGREGVIGQAYIKPGAVVIDVGVNRNEMGKLVGDVLFDEAKEIAGYITPVPGGVGPMTITMLLYNTVASANKRLTVRS